MNLILLNWVKFYTKETLRTLRIVLIGTFIILAVVFIKFKPAYKVTLAGEDLGYVENKDFLENRIKLYINSNLNNIAFREVKNYPEYKLALVNRTADSNDDMVLASLDKLTVTTYKMYAITSDGEEKAIVYSYDEAQNIIDEVKKDVDANKVSLNLGITDYFTTDNTVKSYDEAKSIINDVKNVKVALYKKEQKVIAAKKAAELKAKSLATTDNSASVSSLGSIALVTPVVGTVSSRFGSRSSSRSSIHTGIDIAASSGTGIRSIAAGKVTYAGWKGTYGNLIIIDHGNGIESCYAHCKAIYVSVGQNVDTSTTIGAVGSTGNSTGPHLHLEMRVNDLPINPQSYLYK